MTEQIRVYGTNWCPDCVRAKKVLNQHQVAFNWIDIEKDSAAADYVVKINKGNRSVPTILFPDGTILVEPTNAELEKKLSLIA
jgi:mycoredoxin